MNNKGEIKIYESANGADIEVKLLNETIWLSQAQMAVLFGKDRNTISEHMQNVFKEKELLRNSVTRKFREVQKEADRDVKKECLDSTCSFDSP